jgi:hypothetical protein
MNSLRIRLGCPTQRSIQLGCCGGFHSRGLSFLRRCNELKALFSQETQGPTSFIHSTGSFQCAVDQKPWWFFAFKEVAVAFSFLFVGANSG